MPLVAHFHGFDAYQDLVVDEYGRAYLDLFRNAAAIVVVSKHMKAQLERLGAPSRILNHIACGVSEIFNKPASPERADPHFLTVGRFVDKKAPHLTILAFNKLRQAIPQATLTMIGIGPLREACCHLQKALGLEKSIDFRGICSHDEVAMAMRTARAFVQHSVCTSDHDMEGTPVAVMEASTCSLPVVATRHGGIPDVVRDNVTGFLVNEYDVDAMADRMLRLAREPSVARRMGHEGRKFLKDSCSMEGRIKDLWQVITSAVEKHRQRGP